MFKNECTKNIYMFQEVIVLIIGKKIEKLNVLKAVIGKQRKTNKIVRYSNNTSFQNASNFSNIYVRKSAGGEIAEGR